MNCDNLFRGLCILGVGIALTAASVVLMGLVGLKEPFIPSSLITGLGITGIVLGAELIAKEKEEPAKPEAPANGLNNFPN